MTSMQGPGINRSMFYDANGERIVVRDGSSDTFTLRDLGQQVLREVSWSSASGWQWGKDYVYRDGVLLASQSTSAGEGLRYHFPDHLTSPRLLTNRCSQRVALLDHNPWGLDRPTGVQDGERHRFTAHQRDLGLLDRTWDDFDHMHARSYTPYLGRFVSVDPGRDNDASTPQSWNLYAYVRNNPVMAVDPDGRAANWVVGAVAGAIIGGGGEALRQWFAGAPVDLRNIGAAAAGGLVSGAIAGGTFGASLIAQAGVRGAVVAGAAANTCGGVVQRELDADPSAQGLSSKDMIIDATVGAIGGGAGHTAQEAVRTASSSRISTLQSSIDRRQAIVDGRVARGVPPMSAQQKLARDTASLAAIENRASTIGTVIGTTATNAAAPVVLVQVDTSPTFRTSWGRFL